MNTKAILTAILTTSVGAVLATGELEILGDHFRFTEGPAADSSGNVYFTDVPAERIYVLRPSGTIEVFRENSGGANGLFVDANENLVACEGMKGRVTVNGETVLAEGFNRPNDLWIDPKGGIYFTDPVYGRGVVKKDGEHVYYIRPDRSEVIRVIDDMVRPNGIIGTPDGKTLYVADHGGATLWKYSILADGTLADKTLFVGVASDGMTLDREGNLYITEAAVQVYSPAGVLLRTIETPARPTNVTFSRDFETLYITARAFFCKVSNPRAIAEPAISNP